MGPALLEGKRWEFIIKAICCVATSSVDHLTVTDKVYECELIRQKSCMQMLCVWKCVWICVCSQCHPTVKVDKTLKNGNEGGHVRKSRVYSACVIWKCGCQWHPPRDTLYCHHSGTRFKCDRTAIHLIESRICSQKGMTAAIHLRLP